MADQDREFHYAMRLDALALNTPATVSLGGWSILLVRTPHGVFAVENVCTHAKAPLAEGQVVDGAIVCPLHGARFELASGKALSPPARFGVPRFDVRIDGNDVLVAL